MIIFSPDQNYIFYAEKQSGIKVIDIRDKSQWNEENISNLSYSAYYSSVGETNSLVITQDGNHLFVTQNNDKLIVLYLGNKLRW